ncbi:beta-propeller fold lactonase family protein [bacterium]|nr:beta-propeller fold lactonase family protein [bacterium]
MGRRLLALAPFVAALMLAGCSNNATFDSVQDVSFAEHVQPVLSRNCTTSGCHNGTDLASGLSVASYAELAAGSDHGTMIVPFEAQRSHLYLHLTGDIEPRMPPTGSALPDDLVRMVGRWIDDGARDELGTAMYSDVRSKAFVACQGENAVAVIDMENGQLARIINVEAPHSVYVRDGELYVSRFETASDNIHVYDADTYELLRTGQAGTYPALMEITPDGSQLWVTNFDETDNHVTILDPVTLATLAVLDTHGLAPHGITMNATGSMVFLTNIYSDNIIVYTGNTDPTSIGGFDVPLPGIETHQPQQCVLSTDESHLFVGALASDQVFVYDVVAEQFVASVTVGDGPWHLTLAPGGTEVWVANWLGNSVSIVDVTDPETPTVTETLAPQHHMPMGRDDDHHPILVRPIGIITGPDGRIYVSCANDDDSGSGHHPAPGGQKNPGFLAVFDPATREMLSLAEVPNFARFTSFRY